MKILVLGGDGMLGHQLVISLSRSHEVMCTLRGSPQQYAPWSYFDDSNSFFGTDIRDMKKFGGILGAFVPAVVINCVGVVKQRREAVESIPSIEINALAPHKIAAQCDQKGIRFVHVSTDCVFNGADGGYSESDVFNANDTYGITKYLGEVHDSNTITIRTSIIGHELSRNTGLLEWFLAQKGPVKGFKKAIFSGLTTNELARVIDLLVTQYSELAGLFHVSSEPITKYDLLCLIRDEYKKVTVIHPEKSFHCDRSLNSSRFRSTCNYVPPAWETMIRMMKSEFEGRLSGTRA